MDQLQSLMNNWILPAQGLIASGSLYRSLITYFERM